MGTMRISGLATNMDTDKMVRDMMKPYNMRVDKEKQEFTKIKWTQDAYRDIINEVDGMNKKYFDVLNGDSYMLSSNNFSGLKPVGLSEDSGLKIKANTTGVEGHYSIKVNKVATKAKVVGAPISEILKDPSLKLAKDILSQKASTIWKESVQFNINKENYNDKGKPEKAISYNFLGEDADKTVGEILSEVSHKAKVDIRYSEITRGFIISSRSEGEEGKINIENKQGEFFKSLLGDNIKIIGDNSTSPTRGDKIVTSVNNLNLRGLNPEIEINTPDGKNTMTKKSNNFTIDGVSYDISGVKEGKTIDFSLEGNSDEAFKKVKGFIEDYNKLIDKIQKKLTEKKNRNFNPLTDEQKKEMKENDIEKWEEKAKSGLLRGDSNLQNMLTSLRRSFFAEVKGAGITLKELGLTTSRNYKDGGKIVFDQSIDKDGNNGEARLKNFLRNDPDKVFKLFSKESTSHPSYNPDLSLTERSKRYGEEGIIQRINDIFKDYTRITRNSKGRRGIFVEKSGIKGTTSEINNTLFKELEKKEKIIKEMERKLAQRENKYYIDFSKLEKYMNKMNSQSAWLAQQFGGR